MSDIRSETWTVYKLRPDGSISTRYNALSLPAPDGWVALRAEWLFDRVDIGYFAFEPGDVLREYFSLDRHYNAFATFRSNGEFVGWYCNITYPTSVDAATHELHWHDLYVDILVLPDGVVVVVDEDELADSGLARTNPDLHATILRARDELLERIAVSEYPFSEVRT